MKVRHFLAVAAAGLVLDQLTKGLAFGLLEYPPPADHGPAIIPGLLYITLRKNPGISWGLLRGLPPAALVAGNVVIVGLLVYFYAASQHSKKSLRADVAIAAIVGGAAGNIVDRSLWRGVLDFIDVYVPAIGFDYPVFNVADILIVLGVGAYIVLSWREKPQAPAPERPGA